MKFAFLVHPLSEDSKALVAMNDDGTLSNNWGGDLLQFCNFLQQTMAARRDAKAQRRIAAGPRDRSIRQPAVAIGRRRGRALVRDSDGCRRDSRLARRGDRVHAAGGRHGGRMGRGNCRSRLDDRDRRRRWHLPGRTYATVPVTTGNSLTIYVAIQNLLPCVPGSEHRPVAGNRGGGRRAGQHRSRGGTAARADVRRGAARRPATIVESRTIGRDARRGTAAGCACSLAPGAGDFLGDFVRQLHRPAGTAAGERGGRRGRAGRRAGLAARSAATR